MLAISSAMSLAAPAAKPAPPSQMLVLGMHHAGTSLVSNLTMMMGAYGGEMDELLFHPENPLKYWERKDVVSLDEHRLAGGLQHNSVADRYNMPEWVGYGFDARKGTSIQKSEKAKVIVNKLNQQRPWVTKDPRMCLVAKEWIQLLDAPMCIIMHREPLSVANSMMIYSHNVSLSEWASAYEAYYHSAVAACVGVMPPENTTHPFVPSAHHCPLPLLFMSGFGSGGAVCRGGGWNSATRADHADNCSL